MKRRPDREQDRERLLDCWWTEQWLAEQYQRACRDSTTGRIRPQLLQMLTDQQLLCGEIQDELLRRGWIESPPAGAKAVETARQAGLDGLAGL